MNIKMSRNSPCLCGSGMKFKKCCLNKRPLEAGVSRLIVDAREIIAIESAKRRREMIENFPRSSVAKVKFINERHPIQVGQNEGR